MNPFDLPASAGESPWVNREETMRIAVLSAALVALASAAAPAPARAQQTAAPKVEDSRLGTISRCMAYYAILGGMDGDRPVDSNTSAVVKDLGTELYSEAAKYKVDEETIQNAVVAALVSINMSVKEDGLDKVKGAMDGECETLVGKVRGMP